MSTRLYGSRNSGDLPLQHDRHDWTVAHTCKNNSAERTLLNESSTHEMEKYACNFDEDAWVQDLVHGAITVVIQGLCSSMLWPYT